VRRAYWQDRIRSLDPEVDWHEITRITSAIEFPWDVSQALSLALFRTYAVPSIGSLLAETGEFTQRVQKRYDDTVLLLDAVLHHGFDDGPGRDALRRINRMHGHHPISNDDYRYVLSTFVVVPKRWIDAFGWRRLLPAEERAMVRYYRELGRHMGIKDLPEDYEEFEALMDSYERERFAFDAGARAVADATLELAATLPPNHLLPARLAKRATLALLDDHVLDAFGYDRPNPLLRTASRGGLKARAKVVARLRPRREPLLAIDLPQVRSYPHGYDVAALGTFPSPDASDAPYDEPTAPPH
jgi:hypothetical protein